MLKKLISSNIPFVLLSLTSFSLIFSLAGFSLVGCKSLPQQKEDTSKIFSLGSNIKVLPSVYLKRELSRNQLKKGQSFNYLVTVSDYSKNAKTLSVKLGQITFPGFKLAKKKKDSRKIKNGRQISYTFTLTATKDGTQKIKDWPVQIKSGKSSKKVVLSAVTIYVGTKKISRPKSGSISDSISRSISSMSTTIYEISVVFFSLAALVAVLYFGMKLVRRFFGRGRRGGRGTPF